MGLPVTERGGPPGGGGIARPEALVGGCTGAEGGATGGAATLAATWGGAGGRGAAGAVAGADGGAATGTAGVAGADAGGVEGDAAAGACAAGATGATGVGAAGRAAGATGATGRTGATGAGDGARLGAGACSDAGRLVTSRAPVRLIGGVDGASGIGARGPSLPTEAGAGPSDGVRSGRGSTSPLESGATFFAAAFLVAAAFLAGAAGSSGCTGRRRPSRSAFLRARSACASSMDEEWLLTPIPRDRHRSSASLLVSPSSCASS